MPTDSGPSTNMSPPTAGEESNASRGITAPVLQAGPAGFPDLADQLRIAVGEMGNWMSQYGPFTPHPSLTVSRLRSSGSRRSCGPGCGTTIPSSTRAMSARCSSRPTRPR